MFEKIKNFNFKGSFEFLTYCESTLLKRKKNLSENGSGGVFKIGPQTKKFTTISL
jgi:hypothetical protein